MSRCWKVENLSDSEAEVLFYGPIASDRPWWDQETHHIQMICPADFLADMAKLASKSKIVFRVNSPGGDAFAALAIANYIKGMKVKKVGRVDGIAASAATILMAAMDTVESPANALWLYHNPKISIEEGLSADELVAYAEDLRTVKESMLDSYMAKATISREEMSSLMDEDRFIQGKEVKEMGLVDKLLYEKVEMSATVSNSDIVFVNGVKCDFSAFGNKPKIENIIMREEQTEMKFENVAQMEQEYPALVAEVRTAATDAERKRMQEIEAIAETMPTEMVNEAKYTNPTNAKDLLYNAAVAHKVLGMEYLAGAAGDVVASGAGAVSGVAIPPPVLGEKKPKMSVFSQIAHSIDRTVKNKEEE